MVSKKLLDPGFARRLFEDNGISVAEWARVNGFSTMLVYQVLVGDRKCLRGQSHRIAIELGLKQGEINDLAEFSKQLKARVTNQLETSKGG